MGWNSVHVFHRLPRFIKWILITIGCIAALVGLGIGAAHAYTWLTYTRYANAVQFLISTTKTDCPDDNYPVHIIIGNASTKEVESTSFRLEARQQGRSSNITRYELLTDDHILKPNDGWGACWSVQLTEKVDDPRSLNWTVKGQSFQFGD
jgi:hypothetical protein